MTPEIEIKSSEKGFTLIELLLVTVMVGVILSAVYSTYLSQQKTYIIQDQVAAVQQNIRSAMSFLDQEVRMAGCDPSGNAGAGVLTAETDTLQFSMDITDTTGTDRFDGVITAATPAEESVTYALAGDNLTRNGVVIAENIDALDFAYLNSSRAETTSLALIRSVQISILARAGEADRDYTNSNIYRNKQNRVIFTPAPTDNFRRRLLSMEIKCRNLGL